LKANMYRYYDCTLQCLSNFPQVRRFLHVMCELAQVT
jgi:hypothetical protein